jgi:hypothetical protein
MLSVYLHVPRTAGTSFRVYAEHLLGKAQILAIYGQDITKAEEILANTDLAPYQLIRGHITANAGNVIGWDNANYITFLRNPIGRVTSLYRYIRRDGGHPIHEQVLRMSLEGFVRSGISLETNDGMVRQLCGSEPELPQEVYTSEYCPMHTPFGATSRDMLEAAQVYLEKFVVVGVVEDMANTQKLMESRVPWARKWGGAPFPHRNRTTPIGVIHTEARTIMELNQWDYELWTWARAELEEQAQWVK